MKYKCYDCGNLQDKDEKCDSCGCLCFSKQTSNRKCVCGRIIYDEDNFFIYIDGGEPPELYCEFCVSFN